MRNQLYNYPKFITNPELFDCNDYRTFRKFEHNDYRTFQNLSATIIVHLEKLNITIIVHFKNCDDRCKHFGGNGY